MRVRKQDPITGDMTFGRGAVNYWINDPRGVGQLVSTRLLLWLGQWYLNTEEGTPWLTRVLGKYTDDFRDVTVQQRILATPGVIQIDGYNSSLDRQSRGWSVRATIATEFGQYQFLGPI